MQTKPLCPKCNSLMVLRTNRQNGSQFWGCSQFPNCRGTRDGSYQIPSQPQIHEPVLDVEQSTYITSQYTLNGKPFNPSDRQLAILDFVLNKPGNLFVNAYAGTGKSTTCAFVMNQLPRSLQIVLFAFNKVIADEFRQKYGLNASTMHSFCFRQLQSALGTLKVDGSKKSKLASKYFPVHKSIRKFISKLAGLALNTMTDYNNSDALKALIDQYGIELDDSILEAKDEKLNPIPFDTILQTVTAVIIDSLEMIETEHVIDYDEMLYYAVIADLIPAKFDIIFVDEYQDTNLLQVAVVKKALKSTGRVVLVGDRHQAIYAFRGAQTEAIDKVEELFGNVTELPLDVTYRCPQSHIKELANVIVPGIKAHPNNAEGSIRTIGMEAARQEWKQLDSALIMCRTNAPLVKACLALIKTGKAANIAGRNIAEGLLDMIEQMDAADVDTLMTRLEEYRTKEMKRLIDRDQEEQADLLSDKVDCVLAFCEGQSDVWSVTRKIDELFTDRRDGRTILFSSVHRAKGSEHMHCFMIEIDTLYMQDLHGQWRNLAYVAWTRSLMNFTFVDKYPNLERFR